MADNKNRSIDRVVITSGPTLEPIDPVRYISNRSSGKSGYHLALEASRRDIGEIIFITGPTCYLPQGPNIKIYPVETARQMQEQLARFSRDAAVIIMSAAVCDYRPLDIAVQKIKKNRDSLTLELTKNPDLLYELGQRKPDGQILVGYAAETHDIFTNAGKKFQRKNLDLLVLNEISENNPAFNVDKNQVYLVTVRGHRELAPMEKSALAACIWNEIFSLQRARGGDPK